MTWILIIAGFIVYCELAHIISYKVLKKRILKRRKWDLNICCGTTDGGGINADIVKHKDVPNLHLIKDIYNLPFECGQFQSVLCSHTIEHVDDPEAFFKELQRVGKEVTIVIPPLYDFTAALNFFEHKFIFLGFRKEHRELPPYVKLPLASFVQERLGQVNHASNVPLRTIFSIRPGRQLKSDE